MIYLHWKTRADLARGEAGYLLSTTVRGFFLAERTRMPGAVVGGRRACA
jgi:hypothetical protein